MHPYQRNAVRSQQRHTNTQPRDRGLRLVPQMRGAQIQCALTGGSKPKTANIPVSCDTHEETVEIMTVTKCPVCGKTTKTEVVKIKKADQDYYYYSFVMNNVPGIIKYENCKKCEEVKLIRIK